MICYKCKNELIENTMFCSKCGTKISSVGIERTILKKYMEQEYEKANMKEKKLYYQTIIDKITDSKYKKVELEKRTIDLFDLEKLVYEDDEKIHINMEISDFAKLSLALVINEYETIGDEISAIKGEFHNDRIARFQTALIHYERAMVSKNSNVRKDELQTACKECISSINELKKEMQNKLSFFENFPKNKVKKLGYIFRINTVISNLHHMREAFHMYCYGIKLLLEIDIQNEEYEKILLTINREMKDIQKMLSSKGYQRLLEIDDENVDCWNEGVRDLLVVMDGVNEGIVSENTILNLLEEKR